MQSPHWTSSFREKKHWVQEGRRKEKPMKVDVEKLDHWEKWKILYHSKDWRHAEKQLLCIVINGSDNFKCCWQSKPLSLPILFQKLQFFRSCNISSWNFILEEEHMETKKIQGANSLLSLEKEKGVELSAKGPSFKFNTLYSISLFAVLSDHHKDMSSSIGASSCEMRWHLFIFLIAVLCLIFLVFGCLDYPVLRSLSSAWGVSLSSAIKPFTSWDLPSCPARLVSIFQQQMYVLHNHSRAELQGDGTVQQDGKRVKKDVTKTRNNTTFHFVHCMLVRIVPATAAGWGRRWQHHVVLHQQIFTLYHLVSSPFTLPHFIFHCPSLMYRHLSSCKLNLHQLLNPF